MTSCCKFISSIATTLVGIFFCIGLHSAPVDPQPFLWKVQHNHATLYLAGSIHALSDDYYPLAPAYLKAFDSADKLVVELDIDAINPAQAQSLIKQKTWLPNGRTLEEYLSKSDLSLLLEHSKKAGTPYSSLIRMRPWMVIQTLSVYQLRQAGFEAQKGVDRYFLNLAKKKNTPILELESLEEQISALADAPFLSQVAALSLSLKQISNTHHLTQLADIWQQANDEALYNFIHQSPEGTAKTEVKAVQPMIERLLDDRNRKMTDVIGIYLATRHTYFILVGALHLSGPNSIVKMLEEKGYLVEKVQ